MDARLARVFFGGSARSLVCHLIRQEDLSATQLLELKRLDGTSSDSGQPPKGQNEPAKSSERAKLEWGLSFRSSDEARSTIPDLIEILENGDPNLRHNITFASEANGANRQARHSGVDQIAPVRQWRGGQRDGTDRSGFERCAAPTLAGSREFNKGQFEVRTLRSCAASPEEVDFPCVAQVALLRRNLRHHRAETSRW